MHDNICSDWSLPDRLTHFSIVEMKMDSPCSAPSILEFSRHQERERRGDVVKEMHRSDISHAFTSTFQGFVATCPSFDGTIVPFDSPLSALTSEPLGNNEKEIVTIKSSPKLPNPRPDIRTRSKSNVSSRHKVEAPDPPSSETSITPGVYYETFNTLLHSGLLVHNISAKSTPTTSSSMTSIKVGGKLFRDSTMSRGAWMDLKRQELQDNCASNGPCTHHNFTPTTRPSMNHSAADSRRSDTGDGWRDLYPAVTMLEFDVKEQTPPQPSPQQEPVIHLGPPPAVGMRLHGCPPIDNDDDSEMEPPSLFRLAKRTPGQIDAVTSFNSEPGEGEEHTLGDYCRMIVKAKCGSTDSGGDSDDCSSVSNGQESGDHKWSPDMLQPDLQDPTGLLLVMDRVMDCFDIPGTTQLSPQTLEERTLDSLYDELEWEAAMEKDGLDWMFPCCNDAALDQELHEFLEEETTLGAASRQGHLASFGSDGSDTLSTVEKLFDRLEIELPDDDNVETNKNAAADQTMTTAADSTLDADILF